MKKFVSQFSIRKVILAVADAFIIGISSLIAGFILALAGKGMSAEYIVKFILTSIVCCLGGLTIFGAYSKLWRYFNSKDYLSCVAGVLTGEIALVVFQLLGRVDVPFLFVILQTLVAITGICLFRYIFKGAFITLTKEGAEEVKTSGLKNTMIIGAGQACKVLITEIRNAQNSPYTDDKQSAVYNVKCVIDDERKKVGTAVEGIPIVGTTHDIKHFVEEMKIETIIFAIPSCLEDERKRIIDICTETGAAVKLVPFIGNLILDDEGKKTILSQIHDINVEELLGRDPIKFDNKDIKDFINGKVCMVTGGGGSIGSELVRQIAKYSPKRVIIVDIYENNAYEIQQELTMEYGSDLDLVTLIASVRDYYRMNQIFKKYRPQVVFHAAAHKHVPLMEVSPMEAIKNNVIGTLNTATLAEFYDVEKFVMISTDKAVNPTNVMGASKRCCEMIVQFLSQQKDKDSKTEFVTTRFGNVLGSNGSVIPLFKKQIEQGKPVTVTHPDIIRYFMTIPEAVSLVMEASAIANGGEIFVLDMGKPVRIVSLAENLIRMYGKVPYKDVEIKFTGLRPGEKIKEELLMNEEGLQKTSNKLIFIGNQIEIDERKFIKKLRKLKYAALENNEAIAVKALHDIVPTFTTPEEFNKKEFEKGGTDKKPTVKKETGIINEKELVKA